jgi:hypothetical protein
MEKRAVIDPAHTPTEHADQPQPAEKRAQVNALDADFRKRLAESVQKSDEA